MAPRAASPTPQQRPRRTELLKNYFPNAANLDPAYAASLAAIPDGLGQDRRHCHGWSGCCADDCAARWGRRVALGGLSANVVDTWQIGRRRRLLPGRAVPTSIAGTSSRSEYSSTQAARKWIGQFLPGPPPALTSNAYTKDYNEVKMVGSLDSTATAAESGRCGTLLRYDRTAVSCSTWSEAGCLLTGGSLSQNARPWHWSTWQATMPSSCRSNEVLLHAVETRDAIRVGDVDGNVKPHPDPGFVPFITAPRFPAAPIQSRQRSSSRPILRRTYGAGGHSITVENPELPEVSLYHTTFKQITDDIDDARVYGGIHFRFRPGRWWPSGARHCNVHLQEQFASDERSRMVQVSHQEGNRYPA